MLSFLCTMGEKEGYREKQDLLKLPQRKMYEIPLYMVKRRKIFLILYCMKMLSLLKTCRSRSLQLLYIMSWVKKKFGSVILMVPIQKMAHEVDFY